MKKTLSGLSKKEETRHFIFAIILLTLIFSLSNPSNTLSVFIVVALIYLVNTLGYKIAANYFNTEASFKIWGVKPFQKGNLRNQTKSFFNGPIIAILFYIVSAGQIFFTAISTFKIEKEKRLGREFPHVTEYETAIIGTLGLLFVLILVLIFNLLSVKIGVTIGAWFILFNLLPLSDIVGAKIWIGSRTLYVIMAVLILTTLFLLNINNIAVIVILALLTASLVGIIYYYFIEYK